MTILVVVQEITQAAGVYCATSHKIQFAHVWVSDCLNSLPLVQNRDWRVLTG